MAYIAASLRVAAWRRRWQRGESVAAAAASSMAKLHQQRNIMSDAAWRRRHQHLAKMAWRQITWRKSCIRRRSVALISIISVAWRAMTLIDGRDIRVHLNSGVARRRSINKRQHLCRVSSCMAASASGWQHHGVCEISNISSGIMAASS